MEYMERFKLHLQLAVNDTKAVRLAQTKDHLVWKRTEQSESDGQLHQGNSFVFLLNDGRVIDIFIGESLTSDPVFWDSEDQFLDAVTTGFSDEGIN